MQFKTEIAAGAVLAVVLFLAGCAATETRRSTGETIDDSVITSSVKTALLGDKVTDGLDIEVEVFRGNVQLNGVADSAEEKARAEEIARDVRGVADVTNNLVVRESRTAGRYIDDKALVARVNAALAKDELLNPFKVDVEANRGVVMLGGFVNDRAQRNRAGEVAANVQGVRDVRNNLQVK